MRSPWTTFRGPQGQVEALTWLMTYYCSLSNGRDRVVELRKPISGSAHLPRQWGHGQGWGSMTLATPNGSTYVSCWVWTSPVLSRFLSHGQEALEAEHTQQKARGQVFTALGFQ